MWDGLGAFWDGRCKSDIVRLSGQDRVVANSKQLATCRSEGHIEKSDRSTLTHSQTFEMLQTVAFRDKETRRNILSFGNYS